MESNRTADSSKEAGSGKTSGDSRKTLNGILYVLKTGCPWADMPRKYGSPTTCWRRLHQWTEDGTWERIWKALLSQLDAQSAQAFLDGSFVRKRGSEVGKTKSGKGSKVMVVADGNGLPIGIYVTSAQPHESQLARMTMESVCVPQKRGRPKNRPKELISDKAYDSCAFRNWLRKRGIKICIPTI